MAELASKKTLNALAAKFHAADGWNAPAGYDYSAAPRDRERRWFVLARLAYEHFFPAGLCACGCGEPARWASRSCTPEPAPYLPEEHFSDEPVERCPRNCPGECASCW